MNVYHKYYICFPKCQQNSTIFSCILFKRIMYESNTTRCNSDKLYKSELIKHLFPEESNGILTLKTWMSIQYKRCQK